MADIVCGECGCANEATIGYEQDQIKHGELGLVTAVFPVWTCNACGFRWLDQKSFAARDGAIEAAKRAQPPTDQPAARVASKLIESALALDDAISNSMLIAEDDTGKTYQYMSTDSDYLYIEKEAVNKFREALDAAEALPPSVPCVAQETPIDPVKRLHNICAALEADADNSAFSREEWDRIDAENLRLRKELSALRSTESVAQKEADKYKETLKAVSRWFAELNRRGERGPSMDVTELRQLVHKTLYDKPSHPADSNKGGQHD